VLQDIDDHVIIIYRILKTGINMLTFKRLNNKRLTKRDREQSVLIGVIDLYIKDAKPVGSNTLKENGFEFLSSATIRNYFSKFEALGYLKQQHSSGGRAPTTKGFREYANACLQDLRISQGDENKLAEELKCKCKKVTSYLHNAAELLSEMTNSCVFLLSPLFDQDFIQEIKLIHLHENELLCVIITDFGQIKTEILNIENRLNEKELKQLEQYLLWRLNKCDKPSISEPTTKLAQKLYNEIMLRHVSSFSSQSPADSSFRTGFSKLLTYPEFQDPVILASSLSLFEDFDKIKTLLNESMKLNQLTCWIGDELAAFGSNAEECAIITIPYRINNFPAGAVAILLPQRTDYSKIFAVAQIFSEYVSDALTKSIYKFKIKFQPSMTTFNNSNLRPLIMLEDKSKI
jgi:heat-inducible transcriptional repressor